MHIVEKLETETQWLKRTAKELAKQMPLLRQYKNIRGTKISCMVNHHKRIKKIFAKDGELGVINYCSDRVKFYNQEVQKNNKNYTTCTTL